MYISTGSRIWGNEFWQSVHGEWVGDVPCAESLPQHILRSLLHSARQNNTQKPDGTGPSITSHTRAPLLSETGVKINTRYRWTQMLLTHTHALFPLYLFRTCPALCLCNALVVLAHAHTGSCLLMAWCKTRPSYILFSWGFFFALSHSPSLGVLCFFHLAVSMFALLLVLNAPYSTSHINK